MEDLSVSQGIIPIGAFKAGASRVLRELQKRRDPLVITLNGRPAAVVLSPLEFDRLREKERFLEAIASGLADAEAGRVVDTATLKKQLEARRAARRRR